MAVAMPTLVHVLVDDAHDETRVTYELDSPIPRGNELIVVGLAATSVDGERTVRPQVHLQYGDVLSHSYQELGALHDLGVQNCSVAGCFITTRQPSVVLGRLGNAPAISAFLSIAGKEVQQDVEVTIPEETR